MKFRRIENWLAQTLSSTMYRKLCSSRETSLRQHYLLFQKCNLSERFSVSRFVLLSLLSSCFSCGLLTPDGWSAAGAPKLDQRGLQWDFMCWERPAASSIQCDNSLLTGELAIISHTCLPLWLVRVARECEKFARNVRDWGNKSKCQKGVNVHIVARHKSCDMPKNGWSFQAKNEL